MTQRYRPGRLVAGLLGHRDRTAAREIALSTVCYEAELIGKRTLYLFDPREVALHQSVNEYDLRTACIAGVLRIDLDFIRRRISQRRIKGISFHLRVHHGGSFAATPS
jgi:hypothetical protein